MVYPLPQSWCSQVPLLASPTLHLSQGSPHTNSSTFADFNMFITISNCYSQGAIELQSHAKLPALHFHLHVTQTFHNQQIQNRTLDSAPSNYSSIPSETGI